MSTPATPTDMITALVRLREALQAAHLPLDLPDVEKRRKEQREMIDQIEDYVLPRLIQIDAPLLTVVGGSTGAGKSTLVNSLVGTRVTEPGVLRPTTRSPVLVHNPADADWFDKDRILPDLARTSRATGDPGALQLVPSDAVPPGLAVLDAPDIDSVEEHNRTLAAQLLAAADLWLFVTSAARYADQVLRGQPTWDNWDAYSVTVQWANGAVGSYASTYALKPGLLSDAGMVIKSTDVEGDPTRPVAVADLQWFGLRVGNGQHAQ